MQTLDNNFEIKQAIQ